MEKESWRIWQGGIAVASVCGDAEYARREILHYAEMYSEDGPLEVQKKVRGKWQFYLGTEYAS